MRKLPSPQEKLKPVLAGKHLADLNNTLADNDVCQLAMASNAAGVLCELLQAWWTGIEAHCIPHLLDRVGNEAIELAPQFVLANPGELVSQLAIQQTKRCAAITPKKRICSSRELARLITADAESRQLAFIMRSAIGRAPAAQAQLKALLPKAARTLHMTARYLCKEPEHVCPVTPAMDVAEVASILLMTGLWGYNEAYKFAERTSPDALRQVTRERGTSALEQLIEAALELMLHSVAPYELLNIGTELHYRERLLSPSLTAKPDLRYLSPVLTQLCTGQLDFDERDLVNMQASLCTTGAK